MPSISLPREIAGGLVLRRATPADAEAIIAFNSKIHSDHGPENPDQRVGEWTRDLLSGQHPTCRASDFTIVEDTATGQIVSTMNLISQTWSYAGLPFKIGRPELVGTLLEYRNRGLVRAQFEAIHALSAERGEMVQAITGIPYYYRLFGYEMALDLDGGRAGFMPHIPQLKDDESEPYVLRTAVEGDLPFIAKLYERGIQRSMIACPRDDTLWRYELLGASKLNVNRREFRVIENQEREPVGYLAHPPYTWGSMMTAVGYELKSGISWSAVTPSVIRYLQTAGEKYAKESKQTEPVQSFGFWLGEDHPVYHVISERLPRTRPPYAFFMRVPDLPAFVQHIAPALEKRLADSAMCGYSGEFKITFYRGGLRLVFTDGKLTTVEEYKPTPVGHSGDAAFPDLTFLQILFGRRDLDELRHIFADCWANEQATNLLNVLFPKQVSNVWPFS